MMTTASSAGIDVRSTPIGNPYPAGSPIGTRNGGRIGKNVPIGPHEVFVAGRIRDPLMRMLWCEGCDRPLGTYSADPGKLCIQCRSCHEYTARIAL